MFPGFEMMSMVSIMFFKIYIGLSSRHQYLYSHVKDACAECEGTAFSILIRLGSFRKLGELTSRGRETDECSNGGCIKGRGAWRGSRNWWKTIKLICSETTLKAPNIQIHEIVGTLLIIPAFFCKSIPQW